MLNFFSSGNRKSIYSSIQLLLQRIKGIDMRTGFANCVICFLLSSKAFETNQHEINYKHKNKKFDEHKVHICVYR